MSDMTNLWPNQIRNEEDTMRRFKMFDREALAKARRDGRELTPLWEGVVFKTGQVSARCALGGRGPLKQYDSFGTFMTAVHKTELPSTRLVWTDGKPQGIDDTPAEPGYGSTVMVHKAGKWRPFRSSGLDSWFSTSDNYPWTWGQVCRDADQIILVAQDNTLLVDVEPRNASAKKVFLR